MKKLESKKRYIVAALIIVFSINSGAIYGNTSEAIESTPSVEPAIVNTESELYNGYTNHVKFVVGSNKVYHNNQLYHSNNPTTIRDGVTYIPLRVMSELLGLDVTYNNQTKEARISNNDILLQFYTDQSQYRMNNQVMTSTHGIPYIENSTLMVPLRVIVTHFDITPIPELEQNFVHLYWTEKPTARFSVEPARIYAGETYLTYIDEYAHPKKLSMVDEVWEGKQDMFTTPGIYTITRKVQDQNGIWSDPYKVDIEVLPVNQPPVAKFVTDKDRYRIGEPIIYTDLSYDDEDAIVKRIWDREPAFFTAGEQQISLEVVDQHGLKSTYTKKIYIEDDVLYSRAEFFPWFTPVGQKYILQGQNVISFPTIKYEIENEKHILYRCNSPETIREEGIYYREEVEGDVRVMVHNQNRRKEVVHFYLVATNNNDEPLVIHTPHFGMGGPHELVTTTGKLGLSRYFNTIKTPLQSSVTLQPGESKIIFPEISRARIRPNETLSVYADIHASLPVELHSVILDTGKNVFEELPYLPELPIDGVHTRGTFEHGNRTIRVTEEVGSEPQRMVFGDSKYDVRIPGIDGISGVETINHGNFGVLYKVKFDKVAPNSIIVLNARGGEYSGAFLVNDEVVLVTDGSHLLTSSEVAVLHRTGNREESVEIQFIPASGSNLPINIAIMPLPEKRH